MLCPVIFEKHNKNGLVRDHIIPRRDGFDFQIPAFIMYHPCNLQLLTHGENVSKGFKDRKMKQEDKKKQIHRLFETIKNYNGAWQEQEQCLNYLNSCNCASFFLLISDIVSKQS